MQVNHEKNIIEIKNVSFSYPGGQAVLSDIDLNIHEGDYLGIIGPNGSGKTTLVKIILGLLEPNSGEIKIFGVPREQFRDWYKIGYVPQKVHVDPLFPVTVYETVSMGRYTGKKFWQALNRHDHTHIKRALEAVGMWELKDRRVADLSGGQLQRVFIARAIATEPKVIFLDEPTVGVDMETQTQFYHLLKKLNHEMDLTLVLISHDIETLAQETTEVACVNKTICYEKNPKEMTKHDMIKAMYGEHKFFIGHHH